MIFNFLDKSLHSHRDIPKYTPKVAIQHTFRRRSCSNIEPLLLPTRQINSWHSAPSEIDSCHQCMVESSTVNPMAGTCLYYIVSPLQARPRPSETLHPQGLWGWPPQRLGSERVQIKLNNQIKDSKTHFEGIRKVRKTHPNSHQAIVSSPEPH